MLVKSHLFSVTFYGVLFIVLFLIKSIQNFLKFLCFAMSLALAHGASEIMGSNKSLAPARGESELMGSINHSCLWKNKWDK